MINQMQKDTVCLVPVQDRIKQEKLGLCITGYSFCSGFYCGQLKFFVRKTTASTIQHQFLKKHRPVINQRVNRDADELNTE